VVGWGDFGYGGVRKLRQGRLSRVAKRRVGKIETRRR